VHTSDGNAVPTLVSVKVASQRLGMSIDDVYDLVKGGEVKFIQKAPGAKIHILSADLDRWVAENAIAKREDVA